MEPSLGQAVGAVAPRHESAQEQNRDEQSQHESTFAHAGEPSADASAPSGMPISHGQFELPTELFSALLKDAQALLPA